MPSCAVILRKLACIAIVASLSGCSPPSTFANSEMATSVASPSVPAPAGIALNTALPTSAPMPLASPQPFFDAVGTAMPDPTLACAQLTREAQSGLYVMAVQPVPPLAWDRTPRQFVVDVCNSSSEATVDGFRLVVFVYFPSEGRPRGQTSELPVRLEPGLHELALDSWIPGLQNHISACSLQPTIEISVAFTFPPDYSTFHQIPFADGKDKTTFAVQCGGHFP